MNPWPWLWENFRTSGAGLAVVFAVLALGSLSIDGLVGFLFTCQIAAGCFAVLIVGHVLGGLAELARAAWQRRHPAPAREWWQREWWQREWWQREWWQREWWQR